MVNQRKKPAENLRGHRDVTALAGTAAAGAEEDESGELVEVEAVDARGERVVVRLRALAPPMPRAWLLATQSAWGRFWASEAGKLTRIEDWTEVIEGFRAFDEYQRCWAIYKKSRTVRGSMGQTVMNPAEAAAQRWLRLALGVFEKFGFNPQARLRLGIGTTNLGRPGPGGPRPVPRGDDGEEEAPVDPPLIRPSKPSGP